MTIRSTIKTMNLVALLAMAIGAIVFAWEFRQVRIAMQRAHTIDTTLHEVYQLNQLTSEYLMHSYQRAYRQCLFQHDSVGQKLGSLRQEASPAEHQRIARLIAQHQEAKGFFISLVDTDARNEQRNKTLRARLEGQLMVKSAMLFSELSTLSEFTRHQVLASQARQRNLLVAGGLLALAYLAVVAGISKRRLIAPITALQQGTEYLGKGDFNHRITVSGRDELALLATAFNDMTAQLSLTYTELSREIGDRKKAQDELKLLNDQLEQRVTERTEELEEANSEILALNENLLEHSNELEALNNELTQANAQLETFACSVSHDLRSPLTGILGYTEILRMQYGNSLDSQAQSYLKHVSDGCLKMKDLIEDLLRFSRLSRQQLNKSSINMTRLVQEVLLQFESERIARQVDVRVGELPDCYADTSLLQQALINLIGNAFKYTRKTTSASLNIGAYNQGNQTVYFFKDNGAGFNMQNVDRLFGVFQRLHTAAEFEGTGVGMALTKNIIERHGGKIWAEGEPGKGATFYFTL